MFTSWNLCGMHKSQKCTLELKLPMERRTGAVHSINTVLLAGCRDQLTTEPGPLGSTLGQFCIQLRGRRPPPLRFTQAASAQQGCPRVCFQLLLFSPAHIW